MGFDRNKEDGRAVRRRQRVEKQQVKQPRAKDGWTRGEITKIGGIRKERMKEKKEEEKGGGRQTEESKAMGCTGEEQKGWPLAAAATTEVPGNCSVSHPLAAHYPWCLSRAAGCLCGRGAPWWRQYWLEHPEPAGEERDTFPDHLCAKKNACSTAGSERCTTALKGGGWLDRSRNISEHGSFSPLQTVPSASHI